MNLREWALPVYTVLMQMAVGSFAVLWLIRSINAPILVKDDQDHLIRTPLTIVFLTAAVAMIGSHFHLSRPFFSFMAVLNVRTSWLSREIVFTVLFFGVTGALWVMQMLHRSQKSLFAIIGWIGIPVGCVLIYCMSRIYQLPTQVAWNSPITMGFFYSTAVLLGSLAISAILVLDSKFLEIRGLQDTAIRKEIVQKSLFWLAITAFIMLCVVIALNALLILSLRSQGGIAQISLRLLLQLYQPLWIDRKSSS